MDRNLAIIERYGPLIRIGVEGKWVEFIQFKGPKPKRAELLALIEKMDRERTN